MAQEMLEKHGVHFMGMGISGGEVGARNGPSLMPGGTQEAWDAVKEVLEAMTAKAVRACCRCVSLHRCFSSFRHLRRQSEFLKLNSCWASLHEF
jgi:6-phosphogluconate dehydrogenase